MNGGPAGQNRRSAGRNLYSRPGLVQLALGMLFGILLMVFSRIENYLAALIVLFFVGLVAASYLSLNATLIMEKLFSSAAVVCGLRQCGTSPTGSRCEYAGPWFAPAGSRAISHPVIHLRLSIPSHRTAHIAPESPAAQVRWRSTGRTPPRSPVA